MSKEEKIKLFDDAKKSLEIIKIAGGICSMRMSITDRAYFAIQKLLQNKEPVKALNPGTVLKTTAHQAFVEQYAVTRDGQEEQKAQETMESNQNQPEKETEVLAK